MQWRDLQNREGFLISKAFKFPYDLLTQYWMEEPVNKEGGTPYGVRHQQLLQSVNSCSWQQLTNFTVSWKINSGDRAGSRSQPTH